MLDKNRTGLIVGLFFAIIHFVWSLCIAITANGVQWFVDWVFTLHMLKPILVITGFNLTSAITLIILVFVVGYIFGVVFATAWNLIKKK